MSEQDKYHHLLAKRIQANRVKDAYGSWRRLSNPDAVPLNYGYPYPDSYPMDELVKATEHLLEHDGAQALKYGGGSLASKVTELAAQRCTERGMDVGEDEILVTNGCAQAINLVCKLFLNFGDKIVVEAPTYMGALRSFRNFGADIHTVEMDDGGIDLNRLKEMLQGWEDKGESGPKFLYTIPNFHNPAGCSMSKARRLELLKIADEYDFIVVEDDAYGELRYEGEDIPTLRTLDQNDWVLHFGSMSKILAPGLRIGWAVGPQILISELQAKKADGGTNPFARGVVASYWSSIDMDTRLEKIRDGYQSRRDAALEALDKYMPSGCSWSEPEGGYFLWLTIPDSLDITELLPEITEEGAMPLAGTRFFPDGRGRQNMRMSFAYSEPDEIERGVKVIARVVERHLS